MPMETAQVTTADLPGGWTRKVRTTASFLPSIQKPESSLDQTATVHNLFSSEAAMLSSPFPLTNVSSLAGLLIFRKREKKAAAQTLDILVPVIYIYYKPCWFICICMWMQNAYIKGVICSALKTCIQKSVCKSCRSTGIAPALHCALPRLTFSTRPSAGNIR